VVIVSYEFAYLRALDVKDVKWDLVVIDEAHRLRSVYKQSKKAKAIVEAIHGRHKVLLTATPLQNTLLELFGLVSVLDDQLFGSQEAFAAQYMRHDDEEERNDTLKDRIRHVCHRTLRRQVMQYIKFTERHPLTLDFVPTDKEVELYNQVSDYLQREVLVALPKSPAQAHHDDPAQAAGVVVGSHRGDARKVRGSPPEGPGGAHSGGRHDGHRTGLRGPVRGGRGLGRRRGVTHRGERLRQGRPGAPHRAHRPPEVHRPGGLHRTRTPRPSS
jgi:hypothetical protein